MNVRTTDLVALVHLGCARNLIDSELILGRMADEGLVVTGDPSEAHTVVLNTCSFIGPAREESHQAIADLVARKKAGDLGAVVGRHDDVRCCWCVVDVRCCWCAAAGALCT